MFHLAMVALLAVVFGLNLRARAQDVPPPISGALGQVQSVENNSTQEGNLMEGIGLFVTLEARPGKEADAEAFRGQASHFSPITSHFSLLVMLASQFRISSTNF